MGIRICEKMLEKLEVNISIEWISVTFSMFLEHWFDLVKHSETQIKIPDSECCTSSVFRI